MLIPSSGCHRDDGRRSAAELLLRQFNARSGEVLGGALVVDHHRCLLGMLLRAGCRGHGAVRQRAGGPELRLSMLGVEARLLSQMVSVDDKSPALDHGSRHLEVFGTQIEIGQQRDEIRGKAGVDIIPAVAGMSPECA